MASPRIVLAFADGVYAFALFAGQLRELEERTDAGPMELYRRLLGGSWRMIDVTETIRLGLLGAGAGWRGAILVDGEADGGEAIAVDPGLAVKLVRRYVETYGAAEGDLDNPEESSAGELAWASAALLAAQIIGAGLMGRSREALGKKRKGETAVPSLSPTAESAGLPSSPPSPIEE